MTPEQEEAMRRALAATARGEDPDAMPHDVVARLDAVLDDLAGPRRAAAARQTSDGDHGAPSDGRPDGRPGDLAARRPRRWTNVLVAAAAVAVIGLAGGAVATGGFGLSGSQGDSSTASDSGAMPRPESGSQSSPKSSPKSSLKSGPRSGPGRQAGGGRVLPELSSRTLRRDVRRLTASQSALRRLEAADGLSALSAAPSAACDRPSTGRGRRLYAVRLDGKRATLALGPVRDGKREARVYACEAAAAPLAGTVVPAP